MLYRIVYGTGQIMLLVNRFELRPKCGQYLVQLSIANTSNCVLTSGENPLKFNGNYLFCVFIPYPLSSFLLSISYFYHLPFFLSYFLPILFQLTTTITSISRATGVC
jgi:hypothetical protein